MNSPHRDDGPVARILWKISQVLEADDLNRYTQEADDLKNRAAIARAKLRTSGEGGAKGFLREDDADDGDEEEDDYDVLVPLFYRWYLGTQRESWDAFSFRYLHVLNFQYNGFQHVHFDFGLVMWQQIPIFNLYIIHRHHNIIKQMLPISRT